MKALTGHTSPATAYTVADYPYGFRLRTSIRYWVETKQGFGQRFVSQTLNPKTGRWNAPKPGTYNAIVQLYLDDACHVQHDALHHSAWEEDVARFEGLWGEVLTENREREVLRHLKARHRAEKRVTVTMHTCGTNKPCDRPDLHTDYRQRLKEEGQLMHALTLDEMKKETLAAMRGETYPVVA